MIPIPAFLLTLCSIALAALGYSWGWLDGRRAERLLHRRHPEALTMHPLLHPDPDVGCRWLAETAGCRTAKDEV